MHEQFLLAALEQAWLGRGMCAPNPSVGAVAVQNNQIIAQNYHRGAGTPHAEQLLLSSLPESLTDVTLYVTLEPCNHWGRTPPCVDLIIQRGIRHVVYAYTDPNPLVANNNSTHILRSAGIDVIHQPLAAIDHFYASYHYWMNHQQPWVTAKMAHTFNGQIAGVHGQRVMLSNDACAAFTHQQRLHTDIILTTAKTINQDNPFLTVRLGDKVIKKPIAILDRQLITDTSAHVFTTAQHCHIFYDAAISEPPTKNNCSFYATATEADHLDLRMVLSQLGRLGYHDVWVEAGSHLFNALHQAGLVQRTYLYLVPKVINNGVPAYLQENFFNRPYQIHWQAMDSNMIVTFDWLP